jgi:hypothetical protein
MRPMMLGRMYALGMSRKASSVAGIAPYNEPSKMMSANIPSAYVSRKP